MRISDWSSDVCSSDLVDGIATFKDRVEVRASRQDPGIGLHHHASGALGRCKLGADLGDRGEAIGIDGLPRGDRENRIAQIARCPAIAFFLRLLEIGRAACRGRVCQFVYIWWVDGSLKKKNSL